MEKKIKVIIDTDIGDDIDDAFALLFAMKLNFDIIGITPVFENTVERAKMSKKLLRLYGKGYENVPVYAGYSTPLAKEAREYPHLCQYTKDIDDNIYTPDALMPDDAVNFIIKSCKEYGDKLTVIAIGPFTNIAKVIEKDKDALNTARVVIMGGAFFKQYADWNVTCDPEAAKIMFDNVKNIHALGADVTHKLKISEDDDKTICETKSSEAASYVSEIYKLWKGDKNKLGVLHDPLAILYSLDTSVCECESAPVAVITDGYARGFTLNVSAYTKAKYNPSYNDFDLTKTHTLARTVDRERVIREFMKCFE